MPFLEEYEIDNYSLGGIAWRKLIEYEGIMLKLQFSDTMPAINIDTGAFTAEHSMTDNLELLSTQTPIGDSYSDNMPNINLALDTFEVNYTDFGVALNIDISTS